MIIVYTGDGKGKTCACVGQALRALGQGMSVAFAQFMKRPDQAGEQRQLAALLGENFRAAGPGFLNEANYREQRQTARDLLEWAAKREVAMLVLDEAIYALKYHLICMSELEPFFERAAGVDRHLALSGRGASDELLERADIATIMDCRKHIFQAGGKACLGVEF